MQILKAKYSEVDLEDLKRLGLTRVYNLRGTPFDKEWNSSYQGMTDILVWSPYEPVPIWMHIRVDASGIPWFVNMVFKISEGLLDIEQKIKELVDQVGLCENRVIFSAYRAVPIQSFGSFGKVLHICSRNEDPEKLVFFLREVEKFLQVV